MLCVNSLTVNMQSCAGIKRELESLGQKSTKHLLLMERTKINRKILLTILFFFVAVFLLTYADWVVNGLLYQYGLKYDVVWYERYSLGYFLLWQFTLILLAGTARSWKAYVLMEAFVLSSTQDLVYFGVWNGGVFPVGDWTWMPLYDLLGFYSTVFQIVLSVVCVGSAMLIVKMTKKKKLFNY